MLLPLPDGPRITPIKFAWGGVYIHFPRFTVLTRRVCQSLLHFPFSLDNFEFLTSLLWTSITMMVPSLITFLLIYIVFYSATSHALPGSAPQPNVTNFVFRPSRNAIVQQHWAVGPPLPILEIGLQHILSMTGENATKAENVSITEDASRHSLTSPPLSSKFTSLRDQQTPAQCSPTQPCIDGSCCNSVRHKSTTNSKC